MKKALLFIAILLLAAICGCGRSADTDKHGGSVAELTLRQHYLAYCGELLAGNKPSGEKFHDSADVLILRREGGAEGVYEPDGPKKLGVEQKLTFVKTVPELPEGITPMEMIENAYYGYLSGETLMLVAEKEEKFDTAILREDGSGGWIAIAPPEEAFGRYLTGGAFINDEVGFACFEAVWEGAETVKEPCVYATFDGGASWRLLDTVKIPDEYRSLLWRPYFLSPVFEGDHGVLPAIAGGETERMIWFETLDGGHTWSFMGRCDGEPIA